METQIVKDLDIKEYHRHKAISKTTLHRFWEAATPAHFKAHKEKARDHFNYGAVIHMAILEPELYESSVVVAPRHVLNKSGGRSGAAWYEWEAEQLNAGNTIILPEDKKAIDYTLEELFQKPYNREAAELMSRDGLSEVSFFWADFETGHPMKCRPDNLPGAEIVADLKSAVSAEPDEFGKQSAKLKYHWSASITLEGVTECTKIRHTDYRYVVVEKTEPFGIAVYKIDQDDIHLARTQIDQVKRGLIECLNKDEWRCYPDGSMPLQLPYWERKIKAQNFFD